MQLLPEVCKLSFSFRLFVIVSEGQDARHKICLHLSGIARPWPWKVGSQGQRREPYQIQVLLSSVVDLALNHPVVGCVSLFADRKAWDN